MRYLIPLLCFFFLAFSSCNQQKQPWSVDVSDVEVNPVQIKRYEEALFQINTNKLREELVRISGQYSFFLAADLSDTLNLLQIHEYIRDPKLIGLYEETQKNLKDLSFLEQEFTQAFRHYKYFFPKEDLPVVYTYVSGIQFEIPVIFADSVLIIGLDNYLGQGFQPYQQLGIPKYITRRMQPAYITVDCIKAMGNSTIQYENAGRTMLDEMILAGKKLLFVDAMLPHMPDSIKIGYTGQELKWCQEHESDIWAFLIENELLFTPDFQITQKFMQDGPFTSGFGNQSPARLGQWLGWQIVRKYVEANQPFDLQALIQENDTQKILRESKYKPKK